MRPPEVTGNDPSPLAVTYRMSISSTAVSTAADEASSLLSLFLPIVASRSRAAKSINWVCCWLSITTPIFKDDLDGGAYAMLRSSAEVDEVVQS